MRIEHLSIVDWVKQPLTAHPEDTDSTILYAETNPIIYILWALK